MSLSDAKAIEAINELIEICKDGEKGFTRAAEAVKDATLRTLFHQYAHQRGQFADQLQKEVQGLGGSPETSGSIAGAIHRGWIDLKSGITGKDDHAILEECERGEDAAKDAYQKALEGSALPGTVLPLVQRQSKDIQEAHDRIRDLRDGVSIAAAR